MSVYSVYGPVGQSRCSGAGAPGWPGAVEDRGVIII